MQGDAVCFNCSVYLAAYVGAFFSTVFMRSLRAFSSAADADRKRVAFLYRFASGMNEFR